MAKKKRSRPVVQIRLTGNLEAALEHAVKRDPDCRGMSGILRDAFWEWYEREMAHTRGFVERGYRYL